MVNLVSEIADLNQVLFNLFETLGSPSLLCVLGSHLLIHLRDAAEEGRNEGTSYGLKSLSAIDFEQGVELSNCGRYGYFRIPSNRLIVHRDKIQEGTHKPPQLPLHELGQIASEHMNSSLKFFPIYLNAIRAVVSPLDIPFIIWPSSFIILRLERCRMIYFLKSKVRSLY